MRKVCGLPTSGSPHSGCSLRMQVSKHASLEACKSRAASQSGVAASGHCPLTVVLMTSCSNRMALFRI
jgi:hypothetical protein